MSVLRNFLFFTKFAVTESTPGYSQGLAAFCCAFLPLFISYSANVNLKLLMTQLQSFSPHMMRKIQRMHVSKAYSEGVEALGYKCKRLLRIYPCIDLRLT